MTPSLLIIDGLNVVRRVYEANPAPDGPAKVDGAMRSAFGSYRRALRENACPAAIAVFDHGGETWRHRLFPDYRKDRKPMPAELRDALPGFRDRLESELGLVSIDIPDVEADDVIALIARKWSDSGASCVILSTDKDMLQLVSDRISVRHHFNNETCDSQWVENKFGVRPDQIGDFLALRGDKSDSIPGVDKVGDKTAAKLLQKHSTLEGVLESAHEVKGVVGRHLVEQADLARLSRQLVDFKTDFELGIRSSELALPPDSYAPYPYQAPTEAQ